MYKHFTYGDETDDEENDETQKEFYSELITELIVNTYDSGPIATRNLNNPALEAVDVNAFCPRTGAPKSGISIHITPTKRKRGEESSYRHQGYCLECGMKTIYQCSHCAEDDENHRRAYICHSKTGRACFPMHVDSVHT